MVTSSHSSYAKRGKAPKIRKLGSFEPYVEPNMHNLYGSKPKKKRAQKPKIHKLGSREPRVHKPRTSEPHDYKWYVKEHEAIPAEVYPYGSKDKGIPQQRIHCADGSTIVIKKNNYGRLGRPPRSSGTAVFHEYLKNRNRLTPQGIKNGAPKFGQKWHKPKKAKAKKAVVVSRTVVRKPARKAEIRAEAMIRRK